MLKYSLKFTFASLQQGQIGLQAKLFSNLPVRPHMIDMTHSISHLSNRVERFAYKILYVRIINLTFFPQNTNVGFLISEFIQYEITLNRVFFGQVKKFS